MTELMQVKNVRGRPMRWLKYTKETIQQWVDHTQEDGTLYRQVNSVARALQQPYTEVMQKTSIQHFIRLLLMPDVQFPLTDGTHQSGRQWWEEGAVASGMRAMVVEELVYRPLQTHYVPAAVEKQDKDLTVYLTHDGTMYTKYGTGQYRIGGFEDTARWQIFWGQTGMNREDLPPHVESYARSAAISHWGTRPYQEVNSYLGGMPSYDAHSRGSHTIIATALLNQIKNREVIAPADGAGLFARMAKGTFGDLESSWITHPSVRQETITSTLRRGLKDPRAVVVLMYCSAFLTEDDHQLLEKAMNPIIVIDQHYYPLRIPKVRVGRTGVTCYNWPWVTPVLPMDDYIIDSTPLFTERMSRITGNIFLEDWGKTASYIARLYPHTPFVATGWMYDFLKAIGCNVMDIYEQRVSNHAGKRQLEYVSREYTPVRCTLPPNPEWTGFFIPTGNHFSVVDIPNPHAPTLDLKCNQVYRFPTEHGLSFGNICSAGAIGSDTYIWRSVPGQFTRAYEDANRSTYQTINFLPEHEETFAGCSANSATFLTSKGPVLIDRFDRVWDLLEFKPSTDTISQIAYCFGIPFEHLSIEVDRHYGRQKDPETPAQAADVRNARRKKKKRK